jgi:hypothetical protein
MATKYHTTHLDQDPTTTTLRSFDGPSMDPS